MAGCQDFEIAVEKRLHGALGEPEQAPIEAHLARCKRCRSYQDAARGAEAGMRSEASAAAAGMDWERVERGIRGGVPASLRNWAGAVLAGFWVAAAAWLSAPPELRPERMIRVLPTAAIVVVLVALVARYSGRRLVALVDPGEMLGTYRQVVAENLKSLDRPKEQTDTAAPAASSEPSYEEGPAAPAAAAADFHEETIEDPFADE